MFIFCKYIFERTEIIVKKIFIAKIKYMINLDKKNYYSINEYQLFSFLTCSKYRRRITSNCRDGSICKVLAILVSLLYLPYRWIGTA